MRLSVSRTKNACSYYIIDSFRGLDGKVKTKVIEKLGTEKHIKPKSCYYCSIASFEKN